MVFPSNDTDFFIKLAELPSEVIPLVVSFLPKCVLPNLLYYSPIRTIVASKILSNVIITDKVERHKWSYELGVGYSKCSCQQFKVSLTNLKEGVRQWSVFPKLIHIDREAQFVRVVTTFPELLMDALSINCCFNGKDVLFLDKLLMTLLNSKIKLDSLSLSNFPNLGTIYPVVADIQLLDVTLSNYVIPGVKKFDIQVGGGSPQGLTFTFSSDLEELRIHTIWPIQVTLPPNLQKLEISTNLSSVDFVSEELIHLKNLLLQLPNIQSFAETGIIAPNLQTLVLNSCKKMSNFDDLRQLEHLKQLKVDSSKYPIGLFSNGSFPKLERLDCLNCPIPGIEGSDNSLLSLPSNLKILRIHDPGFLNADFSNLAPSASLDLLNLHGLSFNDGYLGDNLRKVYIRTSKLTLASNFRIPCVTEEISLEAKYLIFKSSEFMCHLPTNLESLQLIACELGRMKPLNQIIKWPLMLSTLVLKNLNIDHQTLKLLNLKESRLQRIEIHKGNVKTLDADLVPVTVGKLTLLCMGIQQLPDSFENLKNLQKLVLSGNQLRDVTSVKLPMAMLETLDVNQCNLRLISPFVVSMLEEKNKNAKLRVYARGNLNVSVVDIRKTLKVIKGLSLDLSNFDNTLVEIAKRSSRLRCIEESLDPYIKGSKIDDLYNGSESNLDEESGKVQSTKVNTSKVYRSIPLL